jgi:AsmA protein
LRRRIALVLALLLLVGVPLLADVIVRSVALGRLRPLVEEDLAEVLGLAVSVGALELSVVPTPHLEATDVLVANLPGRRVPHLLEIAELEIGIALWPLLDRQLVVDALALRGVVLDVETDAEGGFELPLSLPGLVDEEQGADDLFELHVRSLRVEDLDVFLIDGRTESVRSLRLEALDVEADELTGPLTLAATGELA